MDIDQLIEELAKIDEERANYLVVVNQQLAAFKGAEQLLNSLINRLQGQEKEETDEQ